MLTSPSDLTCSVPWPGEVTLLAICYWQLLDLPTELGDRKRTSKVVFAGLADKSDTMQCLGLLSPWLTLSLEDVSISGSADLDAVKGARSKNSHKISHLNVSFFLPVSHHSQIC